MTDLIRTVVATVAARANHGRWIADCLLCNGALILRPGTPAFDCPTCGSTSEVVWPSEQMCRGIVRLLTMRPDPATRNWEPGETLVDLAWENGQHGVFDAVESDSGEPSIALTIAEDRIMVDTLPDRKAVLA